MIERVFEAGQVKDLKAVAEYIVSKFGSAEVVLFEGQMGAGKTTLISEVCRVMGVDDTVSSPTFSIVNEYLDVDGKSVYHFDLYRLKNVAELHDIGMEEYLYSGRPVFIEWPELATDILPSELMKVNLSDNGDKRIITVQTYENRKP